MIEVYYAEDDETIGKSVKEYLEQQNCKVAVFDRIADVKKALIGHLPTIVLLDWNMPDGQGSELCLWIRERWKTLPIVYLTIRGDSHDIVTGFQNGADDYVVKPFNPLELTARVKSQLRRYTQLNPNRNTGQAAKNEINIKGLSINKDNHKVVVYGEEIKLTPIEYNILLLLVKNAGKVFSIDEIYEQIWNEEAIGADNTVAVHIRHIREKIEINPREPKYLKVVWGVGYKIEKQ